MTKKEREQKAIEKLAEMKAHEDELRASGYRYVAGIDEVGRGPLAGPVYAACVILPEDFDVTGVNDSKKLSAKKREELSDIIKERAVAWGIGIADNKEIDRINILEATKAAMKRAIMETRKMLAEKGLLNNSTSAPAAASNSGGGDNSTPGEDRTGSTPGEDRTGSAPGEDRSGGAPGEDRTGSTPGEDRTGSAPGEDRSGSAPGVDAAGSKAAPARDILLIDAVKLDAGMPSESIIKGDEKCLCIAAASIIAKVARDAYMTEMASVYPGYGFESNKGYGTAAHYEGLMKLGKTPIHRLTFLKKFDENPGNGHSHAGTDTRPHTRTAAASAAAKEERNLSAAEQESSHTGSAAEPEPSHTGFAAEPESFQTSYAAPAAAVYDDRDPSCAAPAASPAADPAEAEAFKAAALAASGKKIYAVRKGHASGIFASWDECKKQVAGFKGAEYKSFANPADAMEYLGYTGGIGEMAGGSDSRKLTEGVRVYVDGSYDIASGRYSCGAVIVETDADGNIEETELFSAFYDKEAARHRNIAGEIMGARLAIEYCLENEIESIEIYHDYEGIGAWADGRWKVNIPISREYRAFVADARKKMNIRFIKVKAHAGNKYNELADKLAKYALVAD